MHMQWQKGKRGARTGWGPGVQRRRQKCCKVGHRDMQPAMQPKSTCFHFPRDYHAQASPKKTTASNASVPIHTSASLCVYSLACVSLDACLVMHYNLLCVFEEMRSVHASCTVRVQSPYKRMCQTLRVNMPPSCA